MQKNDFEEEKLILQRRRTRERLSIISQFCHLATFSFARPESQLECGTLVTSIDVDVGSSRIAEINNGGNDCNVHDCLSERYVGGVEEKVVPVLAQFFDDMEIPVTFAVRGQLAEIADPILLRIINSPIKHEIAGHGYYHKNFMSLTKIEAQHELEMIYSGFQKVGLKPKSFVFPRNGVNHLDLLVDFGYKSYREKGGLLKDGMFIHMVGQLCDVHPGFHLGYTYNPIFLKGIINIASRRKLPLHIWFHPRDIYETRRLKLKSVEKVLFPIYNYAKEMEKEGTLQFKTMDSIVNKIKKIG